MHAGKHKFGEALLGIGFKRLHKAYLLSCLWMSAAIPMHAGKHKFGEEKLGIPVGGDATKTTKQG